MQSSALVESIIATQFLAGRPDRRRDFKRENEFLQDFALRLADSDRKLLDRLVRAAIVICEAGSAGLSLHGTDADGNAVLKWEAVAGQYAKYLGGTLPLFSPCGVCLERGRPELFDQPERVFTYLADVRPEIAEALVIPLQAAGRDFGTIWIASHGEGRQFTDADLSFMTTLANFTAAALTLMGRESSAWAAARDERLERERAERTNRLKDEFLSTISHELRTPLHAILSWSELLADGLPAHDAREAVDSIHRNAERQVRLVDDLLDSSRYLAGGLHVEVEHVELRNVVASVIDAVRPALAAKALMVRLLDAPGPTGILGDVTRLEQAIGNVVANAIKFSRPHGAVTVVMEPGPDVIMLRISDEGIGIAPDFLPLVFERFSQADSSSRRREGGLGLGLAIARDICNAHGGSIEAFSAGPDRGATFTFTLPLAVDPNCSSEITEVEPDPQLAHCTILVVDDEADSRDAFAMVLRHRGATVRTAGSFAESLTCLDREVPDLVLTDIAMPGRDGFCLLRGIRQHTNAQVRAIPVLAVTAHSSERDQARLRAAGFDGYVAKPLPARDLVQSVIRLLRHHH